MKKLILIPIVFLLSIYIAMAFNQTDSLGLGITRAYKFEENNSNKIIADNTTNWNINNTLDNNASDIDGIDGIGLAIYNTNHLWNRFPMGDDYKNFTLNYWLSNNGDNDNGEVLMALEYTHSQPNRLIETFTTLDRFYTSFRQNGTYHISQVSGTLSSLDTWTMYSFVAGTDGCYLYENSTMIANYTGNCEANFQGSANTWSVGQDWNKANGANGIFYLDEVYFWNRSLTSSEINDLYNSGAGSFLEYVAPPVPPSVNYTITSSAGNNGTIYPLGSTIKTNGTSQNYNCTPDTHFSVEQMYVDSSPVGALTTYTFNNIQVNHTIHCNFTQNSYTITASSGDNGSITPSGAVVVLSGEDEQFNFTPDSWYVVDNVSVDSSNLGNISTYTFNNVIANHTIYVNFSFTGACLVDLDCGVGWLCSNYTCYPPLCTDDSECSFDQSCENYICQDKAISWFTKLGDMFVANIGATFFIFAVLLVGAYFLVRYYWDK